MSFLPITLNSKLSFLITGSLLMRLFQAEPCCFDGNKLVTHFTSLVQSSSSSTAQHPVTTKKKKGTKLDQVGK